MEKTFIINEKVEISFSRHKIVITDGAFNSKLFAILIFGFLTFYGVLTFLKYLHSQNQIRLLFGLFIGLFYSIFLILLLLTISVKSEISLDKVKSIKIKHIFSSKYLFIKLNHIRIRPVMLDGNIKELEHYINTRFGTS